MSSENSQSKEQRAKSVNKISDKTKVSIFKLESIIEDLVGQLKNEEEEKLIAQQETGIVGKKQDQILNMLNQMSARSEGEGKVI